MKKGMKIWLTYFYNIRFLEPHQVPLSTAIWDPAWYKKNGTGQAWKDDRGVICGLRIEELNPKGCHAVECCPCDVKRPGDCLFLQSYLRGLRSQDFQKIYTKLEGIQKMVSEYIGKEAELVLVVYEVPSNPCSERKPLMDWFLENGIKVEEFNPINK